MEETPTGVVSRVSKPVSIEAMDRAIDRAIAARAASRNAGSKR